MNELQIFLRAVRGSEVFYMNLAQDRGMISDLCVSAAEVWPTDASQAVTRMMGRPWPKVKAWLEADWAPRKNTKERTEENEGNEENSPNV